MAGLSRRVARLAEATKKQTSRIIEANLFGLPVLHSLPIVSQALSSEHVRSTSCYFSTMAMRLERVFAMLSLYRGNVL
jgi:hypothetical protein